MRKWLCLLIAVLMLMLSACNRGSTSKGQDGKSEQTETSAEGLQEQLSTESTEFPSELPVTSQPTTATESTPQATQASTQATTVATKPAPQPETPTHSAMYIPGVETDSVIRWFHEVVLDAEFVNSGDATLLQKWGSGISYALLGAPTPEDETAVENMAATLNGISGFPGMYKISDPAAANLKIHFVSNDEMLNILGDNFIGCDGGVTFWYDGNNSIYEGVICIRTDLDQHVRNSVILEEIYNGLGPVQDTDLRSDSLIYSGYSTPQQMTQVDKLIMQLLYHPHIKCGMTAKECETVIRQLYY